MKIDKSENTQNREAGLEAIEVEGLSQGQLILRRFLRHRAAMFASIALMSIILFVYTASGIHLGSSTNPISIPGWWPNSIQEIDTETALELTCNGGVTGCPTMDLIPEFIDGTGMQIGPHPFGTDVVGTDYFALVMRGAEQSIMVMFIVGLMGIALGTFIGAIAGFYGGIVDAILMRVTDVFIVTPTLIIGSVVGASLGNLGIVPLAVMLGFFAWMGLARFVRTEFLSLREREFVDAARVAGASNLRIIFKHILPNAIGVIIVSGTLLMSGAILTETALSYLGFGVQAPDVSLGMLISQNEAAFSVSPWLFWWPGFFIVSIALCVNFIGDGLRDAFDPRQKRRITLKDRMKARETKAKA